MRILVVCAGNTCRSPAGEAAIRAAAARARIGIEVTSAGTSAEQVGAPPTPAMVAAGRARGLEITGSAAQVTKTQVASADLILAMDRQTELFLRTLGGTAPIELFAGYDSSSSDDEIADPYGADDASYAATLDRIISAAEGVVESLSD